jgi:hypothetical protein
MKPFSFETVYEYFARICVEAGLPKDGEHPPMMFLVQTLDDQIVSAKDLPTVHFFRDNAGKDRLGMLLSMIVPNLPANMCLVLMSEAYVRTLQAEPGEKIKDARARGNVPQSLADDPQAEEVLLIQIYRPGETRMGRLPIKPDRSLEYRPLEEQHTWAEGRLVPETTPTDKRTAH